MLGRFSKLQPCSTSFPLHLLVCSLGIDVQKRISFCCFPSRDLRIIKCIVSGDENCIYMTCFNAFSAWGLFIIYAFGKLIYAVNKYCFCICISAFNARIRKWKHVNGKVECALAVLWEKFMSNALSAFWVCACRMKKLFLMKVISRKVLK